ncbi:MAG TPA: S9 family peptidase [Anaerolineaceae bacterium]|nr:S9 family peptidase [Anaerolineaceae bacterium]
MKKQEKISHELRNVTPNGLWPSPISANMLSSALRLEDVQWAPGSDMVLWQQSVDGKTTIWAKPADQAAYNLTPDLNPGGGVGYGGGAFKAGKNGIYFVERNGRIYSKPYGPGLAKPLTPAFGAAASPAQTLDERFLVYVHTYEGKDCLALIELGKDNWPNILASGADFYMQPTWSPDGTHVAWVEWNHPNMPWDGCLLKLGTFNPETRTLSDIKTVDGDSSTAIFQPIFSPNGMHLAYMASRKSKDEITLYQVISEQKASFSNGHNFLPAAWVQGIHSMAWNPTNQALYWTDLYQNRTRLARLDVATRKSEYLPDDGFTLHEQLALSDQGTLVYIGQSPKLSPRVLVSGGRHPIVVARSQTDQIEQGFLADAADFTWVSSDGQTVHGLYFAPFNQDYISEQKPPVICYIHGGPTSVVNNGFNLEADYFTSRGYAYFVVNYRGSTGFGRDYREALNGQWGDLDVQDAVEGCQALVNKGLADPDKLVIKGGSAGGYTVLNALIRHPGFFKAGLCSYGVANLFLFEMDTHKFESHYNKKLIGTLPQDARKFHDWSPVFHAEKIKDAIAVFQGSDDKVVPLNQSEEMVSVLKANGVNVFYRVYQGEGHGFRKSENIKDFYESIDRFLKQYVIFSF